MNEIIPDFLSGLPAVIAGVVSEQLPGLRECRAMDGRFDLAWLRQAQIQAPSVLISHLGSRQAKGSAGGLYTFDLAMAAYVVTRDAPALKRDTAAANIVQFLLSIIPDHTWAQLPCGGARDVFDQTLVSASTKGAAASLRAVTWTQPCHLVRPIACPPVDIELYVGQAPNIGAAHVADYTLVAGGAE